MVYTQQPSKNDSDDYKGLRIGDLRLHAALTWRDFRFIVISGFYPFLASFVNQRTLIVFPNDQQGDSGDNRGLRTRDLRHGAFMWRHFRFIIVFCLLLAERERTRVPDVIFARSVRGRAEEKRAALEGFPVATSVHGGRDRTVRG